MLQSQSNIDDKNRSAKIRDGIARAEAQGRKLGRPTVSKAKGDPYIVVKAAQMRAKGLSWGQIASRLMIGRTTARRLVIMYQKEKDSWIEEDTNSSMPKCNVSDTQKNESHNIGASIDDDILGKMPKTFQMFSKLLEKAREEQQKRGEI